MPSPFASSNKIYAAITQSWLRHDGAAATSHVIFFDFLHQTPIAARYAIDTPPPP